MATFNIRAARADGLTDDQIQSYLASNPGLQPSEPLQSSNQQGIASTIGRSLIDTLVNPFIKTGQGLAEGGKNAVSTIKLLANKGSKDDYDSVVTNNSFQKSNKKLLEGEAGLASFLVPGGKGLSAAAKAGAVSGGLYGLSEDSSDPSKILGNTALGGVFGIGGGLVDKAIGKGAKSAGKALSGAGDDLATRSLKPSPTHQKKFTQSTGKQLSKVLQEEGLIGKSSDDIAEAIKPVQQMYDDMVSNAGTKVSGKEYANKLLEKAAPLVDSDNPAAKKIGSDLLDLASDIEKRYGTKQIDAAKLLEDRRLTDKLLPKNAFMNDPEKAGVNRLLRDTQKELIDSVSDTGETGSRLRDLYQVLGIAEQQSGVGKGTNPIGLLNMLGIGSGATLGGPVGAVAGYGVTKAANSPQVISAGSKAASGIGEKLLNAGDSNIMSTLSSILGPRSIDTQSPQVQQPQSMQSLPSADAGQSLQSTQDIQQIPDQEDKKLQALQLIALRDIQKTGGKNLDQVMALSKILGIDLGGKSSSKPKSSAALQVEGKATAGIEALQRIENRLNTDPNSLLLARIPGSLGARDLEADYSSITDAIGGLRTGATVSKEQQKFYRDMLPGIGDREGERKRKIAAIKRELEIYLQGSGSIQDPMATP